MKRRSLPPELLGSPLRRRQPNRRLPKRHLRLHQHQHQHQWHLQRTSRSHSLTIDLVLQPSNQNRPQLRPCYQLNPSHLLVQPMISNLVHSHPKHRSSPRPNLCQSSPMHSHQLSHPYSNLPCPQLQSLLLHLQQHPSHHPATLNPSLAARSQHLVQPSQTRIIQHQRPPPSPPPTGLLPRQPTGTTSPSSPPPPLSISGCRNKRLRILLQAQDTDSRRRHTSRTDLRAA